MHEIASEQELQTILEAGKGFLANKKESGGTFRVHDLHGACKKTLGYSPQNYPKFFSETTYGFDMQWGPRGWDSCGLCQPR